MTQDGGNMRALSLGLTLFMFWLALSGHYTAFLVSVGLACVVLCVFVAYRMGIIDFEGHPVGMVVRAPSYWLWLWWEIAKSSWAVTRIILDWRLPVSPTLTRVRSSQKTAPGRATYANSITLTPGTITAGVEGDQFTVHALMEEGAGDLETGRMDRRVCEFEGQS